MAEMMLPHFCHPSSKVVHAVAAVTHVKLILLIKTQSKSLLVGKMLVMK